MQSQESANFGTIAIVVTIISILFKEGLAQFAFWAYRKTELSTMKADGWHHRSDALSSVLVLAGIFLKDYFWWIDGAMGIAISLMLFYAVFSIIKDAISKILGEKPSEEVIKKVVDIVNQHSNTELYPHHFHLHDYVNHKELTFHIKLDENTTIKSGHELATDIELLIMEKLNISATIHLEPNKKK